MTKQLEITNGPCKHALETSLFYGGSGSRVQVEFRTVDGETFGVIVQSASREDGSGDSWNLKCYLKSIKKGSAVVTTSIGKLTDVYYRTDRRVGHFVLDS